MINNRYTQNDLGGSFMFKNDFVDILKMLNCEISNSWEKQF